MTIPGVWIECQCSPSLYSIAQLEFACRVAYALDRGPLLLLERPALLTSDEAERER